MTGRYTIETWMRMQNIKVIELIRQKLNSKAVDAFWFTIKIFKIAWYEEALPQVCQGRIKKKQFLQNYKGNVRSN